MFDKIGATDEVTFILNGKPIQPKAVDYCIYKQMPGGCPLHNLHCGYPKCNEPPAEKQAK